MEIIARRSGEQLVFALTGRMDGTGAQQVSAAIQQNLTDHDLVLIFDMGGVDYLSSAGLRVFQESARKMKERNGRIAVCRVQDFVRKLFASGGFFRLLADYPDVESAIAAMAVTAIPVPAGRKIAGAGWTLEASHLSDTEGTLVVTGDLQALYTGKVTAADVREVRVPPGGFGAGTAAMAESAGAASPLVGEMVQADGTVYWIPTDGNLNPDFFTGQDLQSSGMKSFALYMASFSGPFSDVLRITPDKEGGMTLHEVYGAIFEYLRQQYPDFSGACAVVLKATVGGLCSSDMKTSVIAAAAERAAKGPVPMPSGHTVTEYPFDGTVVEKVSAVDVKPKYSGDILISVGYGIDTAAAAKTFSKEVLAAAMFSDPRTGSNAPFLYNKGIVYKNLPWDSTKPFEEQVKKAPSAGEFAAVHNLLNITTVRSAVAGVIPLKSITKGD
jgi:anti-anti-sigma factor